MFRSFLVVVFSWFVRNMLKAAGLVALATSIASLTTLRNFAFILGSFTGYTALFHYLITKMVNYISFLPEELINLLEIMGFSQGISLILSAYLSLITFRLMRSGLFLGRLN